jgi:hypothetical protein
VRFPQKTLAPTRRHSFHGGGQTWCRASSHTQENAPSFKFPHDRGRNPESMYSCLEVLMSRRLLVMVLLLFRGPHSSRAEDAYDLKREIGWARSHWSADLKGLHFHSPTAKLLEWVPRGGAIKVWMFTGGGAACVSIDLRRVSDGDGEALVGKHFSGEQTRSTEPSRTYTSVVIRSVFTESRDYCAVDIASGASLGCCGIGEPDRIVGVLSDVGQDSARFDGEEIALHPECDGPIEWLRCKSAGKRPCARCERVSIIPTEAQADFSSGGPIPHADLRRATCNEACPAQPSSPILARLEELERRTHIWRRRHQPLTEIPSLHRTLAGCVRDHFPKGRPTEAPP